VTPLLHFPAVTFTSEIFGIVFRVDSIYMRAHNGHIIAHSLLIYCLFIRSVATCQLGYSQQRHMYCSTKISTAWQPLLLLLKSLIRIAYFTHIDNFYICPQIALPLIVIDCGRFLSIINPGVTHPFTPNTL